MGAGWSVGWQTVNPLLFREPRSTANWASPSVFGEHLWSDRDTVELPRQFRASKAPAVSTAIQVAGVALPAVPSTRPGSAEQALPYCQLWTVTQAPRSASPTT